MEWNKVKLGDILLRRRDSIKVLPNDEYKLVTIRLYHKGVTLRNKVKGLDIKSPMSKIKTGDFILSGIDARNGAFGIVPEELDGAIVTNDFWCLDPDENRIDKDFLLFLTTTNFFDNICKESSDGTTQRIRLQKDKFFNYSIFLPSVEEQIILTKQFKKLEYESFELKNEFQTQLSLVKQLRQSFLSEAMEGKLLCHTEQSEVSEETGQRLLARIKAEKAQLIKDKKLKKEKELPPIKLEDIPFEIPKDWVWCRLGEICYKITDGFHNTPPKVAKGYPYIAATHVKSGKINWKECHFVSEKYHRELFLKASPTQGELLVVNIGAGSGTPALIDVDFEFSFKNTAILKFNQTLMNNYLIFFYFLLNRSDIYSNLTKGGLQPFLSLRILNELIFPLPPLSAQNQIVAKLDELMKNCDDLENSIKQSQIQNEQLLQQVLKEALEVKNL